MPLLTPGSRKITSSEIGCSFHFYSQESQGNQRLYPLFPPRFEPLKGDPAVAPGLTGRVDITMFRRDNAADSALSEAGVLL